jgi:hypothetical protein
MSHRTQSFYGSKTYKLEDVSQSEVAAKKNFELRPKPIKSGWITKILELAKGRAPGTMANVTTTDLSTSAVPLMPDEVSSSIGNEPPAMDWAQVRFEANRSTVPLSRIERIEREEWCRIMDYPYTPAGEPPVPIEGNLNKSNGDEVLDGNALAKPTNSPELNRNPPALVEKFETSLVRIQDSEVVHISFALPADVECVAETEVRLIEQDLVGPGEVIKKRALTQAEWVDDQKHYSVKALLPGNEERGVLKVYTGRRGLMCSIEDNPHTLAFELPIIHLGESLTPYEFVTRYPTPHAQRHDIYIVQPQCQHLAPNNTYIFEVRQHPSVSITPPKSYLHLADAIPDVVIKPTKLAIQGPSGKIFRLTRKGESFQIARHGPEGGSEESWETIIKCGERGLWRGLVLADRSARWCVFAEWTCI